MKKAAVKFILFLFVLTTFTGLKAFSSINVLAGSINYYVDQNNGNDSFDGKSEQSAFKNLQPALSQAQAGDTVLVKNGVYSRDGGSSFFFKFNGEANKYITLKNFPGQKPKLTATGWCVFCMDERAYITIQGFEITNTSSRGDRIDGAGGGIGLNKGTHHIIVENNIIHDTGGSGIVSNNADYTTVNGNIIYKTSKESTWGASGINLNHNANWDTHPGTGYNNFITNNVVYANEQTRPSNCCGNTILDGNGIILDRFNEGVPYTGRTLIANNLIVQNGGRGIDIYRSVNTDIINNTLYKNNFRPEIQDGDLVVNRSTNIRLYNNLIQSRDEKHCGYNTNNINVTYDYNLCFSKRKSSYISPNSIQAEVKFVSPSSVNITVKGFELAGGSVAINKGGMALGVDLSQLVDLAGKPRVQSGRIDIGALEYKN